MLVKGATGRNNSPLTQNAVQDTLNNMNNDYDFAKTIIKSANDDNGQHDVYNTRMAET